MSGENVYLITADGARFPLAEYGVEVSEIGNIPVEYETARGYGQHGATVFDWRLRERAISLALASGARDRRGYWALREKLLNALRPNRGGALTLRFVQPNGARRDIRGWLQGGLSLTESADGRNLDAAFSLLCPDPAFYDPALVSATLVSGDAGGFYFPAAFPIFFTSGAALSLTLSYAGTWYTYPAITISGPYTGITISNATTGGYITLSVALTSSQTRIIDLTPGAQSIVDAAGNNRISDMSDGNLLDWYLTPGENIISANISGFDANTAVALSYRTRYIAL